MSLCLSGSPPCQSVKKDSYASGSGVTRLISYNEVRGYKAGDQGDADANGTKLWPSGCVTRDVVLHAVERIKQHIATRRCAHPFVHIELGVDLSVVWLCPNCGVVRAQHCAPTRESPHGFDGHSCLNYGFALS